MRKLAQEYTLDGTGIEIDNFSIADRYEYYTVIGTATAIGNYNISVSGTPTKADSFLFRWRGVLDISGGQTFSILGTSITENQLLYDFDAVCSYNGTTWDVLIDRNSTGVTSETINYKLDSVTNAVLAEMADLTLKGNISGGTANPSDIPISTIKSEIGAWNTDGNSGLTAGTNFLGTTDNVDLVFKRGGVESGRLTLTESNTSFGLSSLLSRTTSTGATAIGTSALTSNTTGNFNTAIGVGALATITTGTNCVAIGHSADVTSVNAISRIALGTSASATADYQFAISGDITTVKFHSAELSTGLVIEDRSTVSANATVTLTVAQVRTGYITSTSAAPTTLTLPTGALLGAELGATQGTIHRFYVDNTAGASTVTVAVAVDGILSAAAVANAASFGLLTVPTGATGVAEFTIMFTSATTYCFSRTA